MWRYFSCCHSDNIPFPFSHKMHRRTTACFRTMWNKHYQEKQLLWLRPNWMPKVCSDWNLNPVQGVTLGGTGKAAGDRHPKIQEGVLIGAGATILGNIVVGRGAMVAAGSLVLKDVPAHRFNCHPLHLKVLRVEGSSLDVWPREAYFRVLVKDLNDLPGLGLQS